VAASRVLQGFALDHTRLAMWMGSGGKHPGSIGFDSHARHPLRGCSPAGAGYGLLRNPWLLLALRSDSRARHPLRGCSPAGPHPLTHYCVIRQDLPRGVLAAQLIHAAGESSRARLPPHTFAIALAARDEAHLESIEAALRRLDIPHCAIREPDPPWNGALMAIGIVPVADRGVVKPITGSLKLLR